MSNDTPSESFARNPDRPAPRADEVTVQAAIHPEDDEARSRAAMHVLGPTALAGEGISIIDAFNLGFDAGATHGRTGSAVPSSDASLALLRKLASSDVGRAVLTQLVERMRTSPVKIDLPRAVPTPDDGFAANQAAPHAEAGQEALKPCGWLSGSGTAISEDMFYRIEEAQAECDRHNDYERTRPDFELGDLRAPRPVYDRQATILNPSARARRSCSGTGSDKNFAVLLGVWMGLSAIYNDAGHPEVEAAWRRMTDYVDELLVPAEAPAVMTSQQQKWVRARFEKWHRQRFPDVEFKLLLGAYAATSPTPRPHGSFAINERWKAWDAAHCALGTDTIKDDDQR